MAQYYTQTRLTRRNADRLLKLAAFLRTLPPKLFDFNDICQLGTKKPLDAYRAGGGCGTTACAIGWTPKVFPRSFEWLIEPQMGPGAHINVTLKGDHWVDNFDAAEKFFGITYADARYLFMPRCFDGDGTKRLSESASAKTVARRIEAFVRRFGPQP